MQSKWIWYFGDFELYHSLRMQLRREEFDYHFVPFWNIDTCWHNVRFRKHVVLEQDEVITVYANGVGRVDVDGKRYAFRKPIPVSKGEHDLMIYAADPDGLPCIYVDGKNLISDETWEVNHYDAEWVKVGCNENYISPQDDPMVFKFAYQEIYPVSAQAQNNGILYDFGKETFAKVVFDRLDKRVDLRYGETPQEALDMENAIIWDSAAQPKELVPRAFRYLYIAGADASDYDMRVLYEYLPLEYKGDFKCEDSLLNQIWDMSAYTFHLNSREVFLDGIKRDRWVWSGDAYQSYLINRYLFFDEDICRRTIIALRGKDPVAHHINTITDYSFYWIMSINDYYMMTGDKDFAARMYPKMKSLLEFCLTRLDKNGFINKVGEDWIFIDWADMDKDGALCAEQMLLYRAYLAMDQCQKILGIHEQDYLEKAAELKERINKYFWSEEAGAYIDCFESGKNNVTRHANIFALLFDFADEKQRASIIENVLLNDEITQIKTPYFKFYELEVLCSIGKYEEVLKRIRDYWGGMIERGATTVWEEFNPEETGPEQYAMYGDVYGKSLCHAWGASPIYLLGRYFLGVKPTKIGYETFEVKPQLEHFEQIEAKVPINGGCVYFSKKDGVLEVTADKDGGVLIYDGKEYELKTGETLRI